MDRLFGKIVLKMFRNILTGRFYSQENMHDKTKISCELTEYYGTETRRYGNTVHTYRLAITS